MDNESLECARGKDLDPMLYHPGTVEYFEILKDGKPLRRVYYRIAEGYLGDWFSPRSISILKGAVECKSVWRKRVRNTEDHATQNQQLF
jgi:dolichol-phosphate mannosyltransferase